MTRSVPHRLQTAYWHALLGRAHALYLFLVMVQDEQGRVDLTREELCRESGLSRETIRRLRAQLVALRLISLVPNPADNRSVTYIVHRPKASHRRRQVAMRHTARQNQPPHTHIPPRMHACMQARARGRENGENRMQQKYAKPSPRRAKAEQVEEVRKDPGGPLGKLVAHHRECANPDFRYDASFNQRFSRLVNDYLGLGGTAEEIMAMMTEMADNYWHDTEDYPRWLQFYEKPLGLMVKQKRDGIREPVVREARRKVRESKSKVQRPVSDAPVTAPVEDETPPEPDGQEAYYAELAARADGLKRR